MLENGEIVGIFALFLGEDESYRVIEDGAWHLDQPYGTIHRLASNGKARGVSKACFDFCTAQIGYLRADTHADNRPMQRLWKRMASGAAASSTVPSTAENASRTTASRTSEPVSAESHHVREVCHGTQNCRRRDHSSRIIPTTKRRFRGIRMRMCASRSTTATVCTT